MSSVISFVRGDWKENNGWGTIAYSQRVPGKQTYLTTGDGFKRETAEFSCIEHKASKELYPQKSNVSALFRNVAYSGLFFPHKALTAVGNVLSVAVDGAGRKFGNAGRDALSALFDGAIVGAVFMPALYGKFGWGSYAISAIYSGYNVPRVMAISSVAMLALFGIWRPLQVQRVVDRVERWTGRRDRIKDPELYEASLLQKVLTIVNGRYPLSRLLGVHFLGKSTEPRFVEVREAKKD